MSFVSFPRTDNPQSLPSLFFPNQPSMLQMRRSLITTTYQKVSLKLELGFIAGLSWPTWWDLDFLNIQSLATPSIQAQGKARATK